MTSLYSTTMTNSNNRQWPSSTTITTYELKRQWLELLCIKEKQQFLPMRALVKKTFTLVRLYYLLLLLFMLWNQVGRQKILFPFVRAIISISPSPCCAGPVICYIVVFLSNSFTMESHIRTSPPQTLKIPTDWHIIDDSLVVSLVFSMRNTCNSYCRKINQKNLDEPSSTKIN